MSDPNAAPKPKLDAGTIINLFANVAAPLAMELVDLYFRAGEVSSDDWSKLRTKIRTGFDVLVPQRPGAES